MKEVHATAADNLRELVKKNDLNELPALTLSI